MSYFYFLSSVLLLSFTNVDYAYPDNYHDLNVRFPNTEVILREVLEVRVLHGGKAGDVESGARVRRCSAGRRRDD